MYFLFVVRVLCVFEIYHVVVFCGFPGVGRSAGLVLNPVGKIVRW